MRVRALVAFHDNLKDVQREAGDEFVVSRERFEEINAVGMEKVSRPIVEVVPEKPKAPESRAAKAAASRRAKGGR